MFSSQISQEPKDVAMSKTVEISKAKSMAVPQNQPLLESKQMHQLISDVFHITNESSQGN